MKCKHCDGKGSHLGSHLEIINGILTEFIDPELTVKCEVCNGTGKINDEEE